LNKLETDPHPAQEACRDWLRVNRPEYDVVGGYISPVADAHKKVVSILNWWLIYLRFGSFESRVWCRRGID